MGKKFAAFDTNGNIKAFYDSVDSPPPGGRRNVIALTDEEWLKCISQQGQWYVSDGVLAAVPVPSSAEQLTTAQASQVAVLDAACAKAIVSGFSSDAVGSPYDYPSSITDQTNQNTIAQCSSGGLLWCASKGTWTFKHHTQPQAMAVVSSFVVWLNKCQNQRMALSDQVSAATSVSAVQSVLWTDPS
ncbi:hypothetical protein OHZ10_28030 [Burkholderia arboris]|uniref:DUF4376 domain-containing protein n=1 Tax=Burkholderia arboris TaxID=488730 RepID=A0ABZ3DMK5_9BURK